MGVCAALCAPRAVEGWPGLRKEEAVPVLSHPGQLIQVDGLAVGDGGAP